MHDDRVVLHRVHARKVDAVEHRVLAQRWQRGRLETLLLDAQHVDDVELGQHVVERVGAACAQDVGTSRHERGRADDDGLGAYDVEKRNERSHDAGVRDVADDADFETVDMSERLANREGVEQGLRGMLVLAVAAVDHMCIHVLRQDARRTLLLAAHDDEVAVHRAERLGRICQGLALGGRRTRGREVDDVAREALAGNLEARARARRGLEEEVDDGTTAQGGKLLDRGR